MSAQTGAFDKINFQGMTETGSFEMLLPSISLFSSSLSSGSSFGELYAWGETNNKAKNKIQTRYLVLREESQQPNPFNLRTAETSALICPAIGQLLNKKVSSACCDLNSSTCCAEQSYWICAYAYTKSLLCLSSENYTCP